MTRKEKYDKEVAAYYESIQITPKEYQATIDNAKQHHRHNFRARKSELGIVFYECKCGAHDAKVRS